MWSRTGSSADSACHCACLCVWKEEKRYTTIQVSDFDRTFLVFVSVRSALPEHHHSETNFLLVRRSSDPYDRNLSHSKPRRAKGKSRTPRRPKSEELGLTTSAGESDLVNYSCNMLFGQHIYSDTLFFLQVGVT